MEYKKQMWHFLGFLSIQKRHAKSIIRLGFETCTSTPHEIKHLKLHLLQNIRKQLGKLCIVDVSDIGHLVCDVSKDIYCSISEA